MGKIYSLIPIIILIFTGCPSIYTVRNFSSKEKFYEDFNKTVKDKQVNVVLNNDSCFSSNKGSRISKDSLILIDHKQISELKTMPLKEIQSINYIYDRNSIQAFDILLQNGKEINVKDVKYLPDSSIQISITRDSISNRFIPLNLIKRIYYKNNWLGIVPGLLIAAPVIYLLYGIAGSFSHFCSPFFNYETALFFGAPAEIVIVGIIGYIIGYTYIYQFNP